MTIDHDTLSPDVESWVASANGGGTDFPLQNLPLGVVRPLGSDAPFRVGTAIGTAALDLAGCADDGLLDGAGDRVVQAVRATTLNALMGLPRVEQRALRVAIHRLLRADVPPAIRARVERHLRLLNDIEHAVPTLIGDYTDFYASLNHATNVGRLFRPDHPLLPNYPHLPIAYHGRASSIVVSGTEVRRPWGQRGSSSGTPVFGPTQRLDFELEVGLFVGTGNPRGESIAIDDARGRLFGVCLLNDWSARDVQAWESQPLGPFLSKSFATTISPWIVTLDALAPFGAPACARDPGDPQPLPYLWSDDDQARGAVSIDLEVLIQTDAMRRDAVAPFLLTRANFQTMYWTPAQLVTHHASNGCQLRTGDLIGSGTVSGTERGSWGSLLEITFGGREPIALSTGESRTFLEDGDEVILKGSCSTPGAARIGFGESRGRVVPAARR